jgi:hypothetical protein
MPTTKQIERAAFCQKQAAYRMEAYWLYRHRGETENNPSEIEKAMSFHGYASECYREARQLMGIEPENS